MLRASCRMLRHGGAKKGGRKKKERRKDETSLGTREEKSGVVVSSFVLRAPSKVLHTQLQYAKTLSCRVPNTCQGAPVLVMPNHGCDYLQHN